MTTGRPRRWPRRAGWIAASLLLGGWLAEGAALFYAYRIAGQGRLFGVDRRLGWRVLPHLDLTRRNADRRPWRVVTDADGARRPWRFRPDASVRVLVLGDSFVFGEGIDLGDRVDVRIEERLPCVSTVDLGVMGYGPDQSLIAARPFLPSLRPGDWIVLVTHWTDAVDVVQQRHSGRSKPWFETIGGGLVEHPPRIGWIEQVRDRSYVLAALFRAFEAGHRDPSAASVERGMALIEALVEAETGGVRRRGVGVLLAHHADRGTDLPVDLRPSFDRLCARGFRCADLDAVLGWPPDRRLYQSDGHWNADGHRVVADALAKALRTEGACAPATAGKP